MFIANVDLRGSVAHPFGGQVFTHIAGRNVGLQVQHSYQEKELYIPSRDRTISIFGPPISASASACLENLDSSFSGATQTRKYLLFQRELQDTHLYFLNVQGTHCGAALLTKNEPLFCYGLATNTGESLMFADHDVALRLRATYPGTYWMFRMPQIDRGVLFWSTEALCSRWYRWRKQFNLDLLKCFNALELMLFERRLEVPDA